MKLYLSIKYYPDNHNRELIETICTSLEPRHAVSCMIRDCEQWGEIKFSPRELMQKTFNEIDACDVLLVEFSEKGVGVGLEIGYTYAHKKPIIVIAREGSDISDTVKGVAQQIIFYASYDDMKLKLASLGETLGDIL